MNTFRTSGDIRPTFGSVLSNLLTAVPFNAGGVTGPHCWAYPDMCAACRCFFIFGRNPSPRRCSGCDVHDIVTYL
jgi:hypothetical protein